MSASHPKSRPTAYAPFADVGRRYIVSLYDLMHPFPPGLMFDAFQGDAIIQVWLDPSGLRFLFESAKQIYAEAGVLHVESDGTEWPFECDGRTGAPVVLHRLLYRRIVGVEREDLQITLRMDDGSALSIRSEIGPYESGQIISQSGDVTVF